MRFRLSFIIVVLSCAVLVNMIAAFGISLWSQETSQVKLATDGARTQLSLAYGMPFNAEAVGTNSEGFGIHALYLIGTGADNHLHGCIVYRCGWPLRCLRGTSSLTVNDRSMKCIPLNDTWADRLHSESERCLPLQPICVPFIINVIGYALLAITVVHGYLFVRRHIRRRSKRCPVCNYDMRYTNRCPECGFHDGRSRP